MTQLTIIIVEKSGELKTLNVKDYKEEDLYKKGGFKKADGFVKHTEWNVKMDGQRYLISMYGKLDGKANMENKYDFPPPVDSQLFFGACVLVGSVKNEKGEQTHTNLSLGLWEKIYEKLFGGFENLALTIAEDEDEEDELAHIPKSRKTKKGGYLKDGFVVDSDENEEDIIESDDEEGSDEIDDSIVTSESENIISSTDSGENGSELTEESYDYSDDSDDEFDKKK
jgi:hypothetical protein